MGAFFTNAQVKVADRDPDLVRESIIEALQVWVGANGFEHIKPPDPVGEADRTIIVGSAGGGQWIPVYDELTEMQYDDLLMDLCTMLSANTSSAVVGILVHDSDVLELFLAEQGKLVDRYVNDPEYFGPVQSGEQQEYAGRAERWQGLLVDGVGPEHLAAIWGSEAIFVEDILKRVAGAIGLAIDGCMVGFNYLNPEGSNRQALTRLMFRRHGPVPTEPADVFLMLAALRERGSEESATRLAIERLESLIKQYSPTDIAMALRASLQWHPVRVEPRDQTP